VEFASFKHVYIIALSVKPRKLEKGLEFARIIQYSAVAQPRRFGRGADRIVGLVDKNVSYREILFVV